MSTEYRFYCPELQREVSTEACYDRGNTGRACYGEVCEHVEKAVLQIAHDRLKARFGEQVRLEIQEADGLLRIRFHENLLLEAYFDRLFETVGFDAYLGFTHGHDFPAENVEGLVCIVDELLKGERAFVIRRSWLGLGELRLTGRDELQRMWRKYARGRRVQIIDGKGVHTKQEYQEYIQNKE